MNVLIQSEEVLILLVSTWK